MAGIRFISPLFIDITDTPKYSINLIKIFLFEFFSCLSRTTTGYTALVLLAFAGSIGMGCVILACSLPQFGAWWPFFVVLFYMLAPIPTLMAQRYSDHSDSGNSCLETAIFLTVGILVCSFALPIVLARGSVIAWGSCWLTLSGNVIIYGTILGFFLAFEAEDSDYNMW